MFNSSSLADLTLIPKSKIGGNLEINNNLRPIHTSEERKGSFQTGEKFSATVRKGTDDGVVLQKALIGDSRDPSTSP